LTTVALLVALGCTPGDAQALVVYSAVFGAVYGVDRHEILAITGVESTYGQDERRSGAGACGVMGVLGGRFKAPPCYAMEAFTWLAIWAGTVRVVYFRHHCDDWALPAYNGAWTNCCGGSYYAKRKDDPDRVWRCDKTYRSKVRRKAARLRRGR
jgi:hypothetical protein